MKGFGIYVKNELLEPKHVKNMGNAIWLYLWLLDKMTSINENGLGKVLGGKPITYQEVYKDVPIPLRNYRRYVEKLRDNGYINTIQTPRGLSFSINKAFKPFKSVDKYKSDVPNLHSDVPKVTPRCAKNGTSNIRQYNDYTKTIGNSVKNKKDFRGRVSPAKERIKKQLKEKGVRSLKQASK